MDTVQPERAGTDAAPAPQPAFPTRRSLREAEARAAAEAARREAAVVAIQAPAPVSPVAASAQPTPTVQVPAVVPQYSAPVAQQPVAQQPVAHRPVAAPPAPEIPQVFPLLASPVVPEAPRPPRTAPHRVPSRAARSASPAFSDAKPRRRGPRKRIRALITVTAVGGLFASAALPAYALTTTDPSAVTSQTTADVASVSLAGHGVEDASLQRGSYDSTSAQDLAAQRANAAEQANYDAYMKSGALASGDDYPYFSSLTYGQGGGLSPLGYFYRECVDFVAWRLNRDAGSTSEPYKFTWSDLTPNGGNASQWLYAWRAHGWKVSTKPKVGSVAWFPTNHVAYVSKVNADGTVLLEEYNYGGSHLYGQRIIPATDVAEYLYAPPQ